MVKIFIVDDDSSTLKLYSNILKVGGFEILGTARNGKEAVSKYKNFNIKPDLIIMDYHMPVKDGKKAAEEILEYDKTVKIVICSGDPSVKEEIISIGALDFIDKPFKLNIFLDKIVNICNCSISLNLNSKNVQSQISLN